MKLNQLLILGLAVMMTVSCRKGCTNQTAWNYDSKAKKDDGSCKFENDPNNPGGGGTGDPNDPSLPIRLTGTENGDITILDKSSNPNVVDYYLDGAWTINANVTVNPGVRIEMRPEARIVVNANGSLNATGTSNNRIDIFGAQNVTGYWHNIEFNSNNPNNKLIYCNVSNGSDYGYNKPGMILVSDNNQVTIKNSVFSKGSEFGLMTMGASSKLPGFESNYFSSFSKGPMRLASWSHANYLDNSTTIAPDNSLPYIHIFGANVTTSTFVPKMNVAYYIRGDISINDGAHVKVESGTEIRMAENTKILVTSSSSLEFDGTASAPCSVIGHVASKGYWYNITFESNHPNNRISYTNVSGGRDYGYNKPGFIRLGANATCAMNNSIISNTTTEAVQKATGATFVNNGNNYAQNCDGGGGLIPEMP